MIDRRDFASGLAAGAICAALPANAGEDGRTGLRVRFLGTGAADWNGRDARGELRRCTSVLLDDRVLIDLTEPALEMIPAAARPETILYTHSHGDHFDPAAALKAGVRRAYVHESWLADARKRLDPSIEVVPLKIGVPVEVGGIRFTSCPANHATRLPGEQTTMYFVEKGETRLLYATDTSGIPAVAARIAGIDAHVRDGKGITALIMEATMGVGHDDDFRLYSHSSVATVAQVARVLKMTDRYHPRFPDQKIYLTHMARTLHGTQKEIEKSVPDPLCPAFDGLEIVL